MNQKASMNLTYLSKLDILNELGNFWMDQRFAPIVEVDLWVQRRSVLDGALDAVLEKLKIHEATGRHLSHYVAWLKVATRTRRTA